MAKRKSDVGKAGRLGKHPELLYVHKNKDNA